MGSSLSAVRHYGKYGLSRSPLRALFDSAVFGGAYLVTFLPQALDRWPVAATMVAYRTILSWKVRRVAAKMTALLGDNGVGHRDTALVYWRMRVETHWMRARAMHRRDPKLHISLEGLEHLEEALAHGRGAILWRMFFCSSYVAKRALAEAGYPLVHLSHWDHGNRGLNWPGLRIFAPMYRKAEVRYLKERVALPKDTSLDHLRRLLDHLADNQTLSIFGNIQGRAPVEIEILGTKRLLASGGPLLARRTGAALLTVRAERLAQDNYKVTIDPPVTLEAGLDRQGLTKAAIAEFARRVEQAVRENPESWYRWSSYADHQVG